MGASIKREPKHRYLMLRQGIGPVFAGKGGKLLLKWEVSWRDFSGVYINTRWGCWWVYFRRSVG
jgi:hypothetical protein